MAVLTDYVTMGLNQGYGLAIIVILLGIGGVIGYFVWLKAQYKYQVHLKVLKHGTFTIWHDTARTIKRNGEHYWRLRKLKELASVPPPESIHQGMKGAWEVEGYYERNIGVIWSRDKLSRQEFEALAQSLQERRLKDPSTANVIDTQYQPITSQERALQTAEITKAALRRGKSGWELLAQLAAPFMMLIVIILIVVFWGKIAEPMIALQESNANIARQLSDLQQQNLRFYTLLTGGKGNGTYIVQELPEGQQSLGTYIRVEGVPP